MAEVENVEQPTEGMNDEPAPKKEQTEDIEHDFVIVDKGDAIESTKADVSTF